MGVRSGAPEKTFNVLQNYNKANRSLRNVNNVMTVNTFELISAYEYICIAEEFPISMCTAKLHVSRYMFRK